MRRLLKDTQKESSFKKVYELERYATGEDDRLDEQCRNNTIKANDKIVKERIWTGLSPTRL